MRWSEWCGDDEAANRRVRNLCDYFEYVHFSTNRFRLAIEQTARVSRRSIA
jgi:hypothetical protein